MASITPINVADLEFDYGTFDTAAFTAQTLSNWQSLAAVIDHTLLKPDATRQQVENLCDEAIRYRFACAMVNPVWASTAVACSPVRASRWRGDWFSAWRIAGLDAAAGAAGSDAPGLRELDMSSHRQLKSGNHQAVHHAVPRGGHSGPSPWRPNSS